MSLTPFFPDFFWSLTPFLLTPFFLGLKLSLTPFLPLLAGSGGIDAGNPAGCTDEVDAVLDTDQRGLPRPVGAACDLGAYEVQDLIFENGFDG